MYFPDISFTAYTTCGDILTIKNGNSDFGPNKLRVLFQTNRNRQNKGFFMVVSCVSPDFGGHKQDQANDIPAPSDDDGGERRRRRRRKTEMVNQSDNLKFIL